jgi:hypothetical protein
MVKYVRDTTGRFAQRPHYDLKELDEECEQIITDFLRAAYGTVVLPIPTDALTKLIERDAADLDLYADLSAEGSDVEGVTNFYVGRKPIVRIAKALSEQEWREHRLRTTLTHEYGHVKFHGYLWQMDRSDQGLFPELSYRPSLSCNREAILQAPATDWMEWQAGYICGSLLMPISSLRSVTASVLGVAQLLSPEIMGTPVAEELIRRVSEEFDVSEEAARVRLTKLGYLTPSTRPPLFSGF